MNYKRIYRSSAIIAIAVLCLLMAFKSVKPKKEGEGSPKRPNIILIMADDMGFSDAGCYGGEIKTPNIDFLANNGIRFKQFYNTSRCCPTRASLLTGLYNQQAGIGNMTDTETEPGYLGHLGPNTVTLAEVLKDAGYQTGMSGKWHVSNTLARTNKDEQLAWLNHQKDFGDFSPLDQYPTARGFDKYFGNIWGVVDFFDPFSLVSGTRPIKQVPKDYYHTDAINDTAVAYINSWKTADKPFFLYVAQTAPHWPLQAKPEDIAKYKDTYKVGWDAIREARYKRMVAMGLIDPQTTKLSTHINRKAQSWLDNPDKVWDAEAMAVHAAMIDRMDQGIGRMINALKENGQLENTLILFLSDNGASSENAANYGAGFDRPSQTRNGEAISYSTKKDVMPGTQTAYMSIGPAWANVANTPYQLWKAESYEGGVHTPMIAYWPKGITAKKGSYTDQVAHVMDFMKTFVELSGAKYPTHYKGRAITPTPGVSLLPAFKGRKNVGHDVLYNEHFGAKYARTADWKLVSKAGDSTWHLYQISKDRTETRDLAAENPEKVKELAAKWTAWANANQVYPKPKGK